MFGFVTDSVSTATTENDQNVPPAHQSANDVIRLVIPGENRIFVDPIAILEGGKPVLSHLPALNEAQITLVDSSSESKCQTLIEWN